MPVNHFGGGSLMVWGCYFWWTVNSIPLCGLLDLIRQALSLLRTVCTDIRITVSTLHRKDQLDCDKTITE
jgi:hypothetical protein